MKILIKIIFLDGYWENDVAVCPSCSSPCFTCSGNATTCLSCVVGYYFGGGICNICHAKCSACITTDSNCTACTLSALSTRKTLTGSCDC